VLQLQTVGGRKPSSRQLPGMQAREGGAAEEEIAENTQNYNRKDVLQHYYTWCLLCCGTPRRFSADRATSGNATSCGNSTRRGRDRTHLLDVNKNLVSQSGLHL
jgi:hypothetical protein